MEEQNDKPRGISADTVSIREMMQRTYRIPEYQREYAWVFKHVDTLFRDIYDSYQIFREDEDPENSSSEIYDYYIGTFITSQGEGDELILIDGQQRIMTFTILFLTALQSAERFVSEETISAVIGDDHDGKLLFDESRSVEFTDFSMNMFSKRDTGRRQRPIIKTDKKITRGNSLAHYVSTAQISSDFLKTDGLGVQGFLDFILDHVKAVRVFASSTSEAVRIFKKQNDSGLDLSQWNVLLAELILREQEGGNHTYISTKSKAIVKQLTQDARLSSDELLAIFFFIHKHDSAVAAIADLVLKYIEEKSLTSTEFMKDISDMIDTYQKILRMKNKEYNAILHTPLAVPPAVFMIGIEMSDYPEEEKVELRKIAQSILYLNLIGRKTFGHFKMYLWDFIKNINDRASIAHIRESIANMMNDRDIITFAEYNIILNVHRSPWGKPVLALIEYEKRATDSNEFELIDFDKSRLTLEHVYPQSPKRAHSWDSMFPDGEFMVNFFGNVTLLNQSKNSTAGNESFHEKQMVYSDTEKSKGVTEFLITQEILKLTDWNRAAVLQRFEEYLEVINGVLISDVFGDRVRTIDVSKVKDAFLEKIPGPDAIIFR